MGYKVIVKEEAREDLSGAYWYYEERQMGLGERFLSEVQKRFDDLEKHPQYYSFIDDKEVLRDVVVDVFPYVLIFGIIDTEVHIYAVLHTGRDFKVS